MAPHDEPSSTPRSALGFALAMTAALLTFWIAVLVIEVRDYHAQQAQPISVPTASAPCAEDADGAAQCQRTPPPEP